MANYSIINVQTSKREEFIDITGKVQGIIRDMNIENGCIVAFVPHTTAGLMINENADPSVLKDILKYLHDKVPRDNDYLHGEGNSDAHIKASFIGNSQLLLVNKGKIVLGTWQGLFFGEFDGPRSRKVLVGRC